MGGLIDVQTASRDVPTGVAPAADLRAQGQVNSHRHPMIDALEHSHAGDFATRFNTDIKTIAEVNDRVSYTLLALSNEDHASREKFINHAGSLDKAVDELLQSVSEIVEPGQKAILKSAFTKMLTDERQAAGFSPIVAATLLALPSTKEGMVKIDSLMRAADAAIVSVLMPTRADGSVNLDEASARWKQTQEAYQALIQPITGAERDALQPRLKDAITTGIFRGNLSHATEGTFAGMLADLHAPVSVNSDSIHNKIFRTLLLANNDPSTPTVIAGLGIESMVKEKDSPTSSVTQQLLFNEIFSRLTPEQYRTASSSYAMARNLSLDQKKVAQQAGNSAGVEKLQNTIGDVFSGTVADKDGLAKDKFKDSAKAEQIVQDSGQALASSITHPVVSGDNLSQSEAEAQVKAALDRYKTTISDSIADDGARRQFQDKFDATFYAQGNAAELAKTMVSYVAEGMFIKTEGGLWSSPSRKLSPVYGDLADTRNPVTQQLLDCILKPGFKGDVSKVPRSEVVATLPVDDQARTVQTIAILKSLEGK